MATPLHSKRPLLLALAGALMTAIATWNAFAMENAIANEFEIPQWFWPTIFVGIVQGIIWYGAINAKLTYFSERIARLEHFREEDRKETVGQIQALLIRLLHRRHGEREPES